MRYSGSTVSQLLPLVFCCAVSCTEWFKEGTDSRIRRMWFAPASFVDQWGNLPALGADVVVVATRGGMIAFDRRSGAQRWVAPLFAGESASNAGDVVSTAGVVCVTDLFGGSGCADIQTGKVLWRTPSDSAWSRQNAIDSSTLYYGTHEHRVLARNVNDGTIRWSFDTAPNTAYKTMISGVALHGDRLYVSTQRWLNENGSLSTGELIALDRETGTEVWRYTAAGQHSEFFTAPVFSGDIGIVSDVARHSLRGIDVTKGTQVWEALATEAGYVTAEQPAAIANDTVFVASTDTQIHAFDATTGSLLFRVQAHSGSLENTAVCGRLVLVVPWTTGPLVAMDRKTLNVFRPAVMIADDELFSRIAVDGNTAYAVGMKGVYAFRCAE